MRRLLTAPSRKALLTLVLIALTCLAGLTYSLQALNQVMAPHNIVAFEFAFTPERAGQMMTAWGEVGHAAARQSLWLDFLYMPAYAFFFSGLALFAARSASGRWQTLGLWLALTPFVAWAFDAIENVALLSVLPPASPAPTPLMIAGAAASIKFGLLSLCWLYTLAVPFMLWFRRWRRSLGT